MTDEQIAKLTKLRFYGTRYELVLTDGSRSFLIAYAARNNRQGLLVAARPLFHHCRAIAGSAEGLVTFGLKENHSVASIDGTAWKVRWSGRTQREAITARTRRTLPGNCNGSMTRSCVLVRAALADAGTDPDEICKTLGIRRDYLRDAMIAIREKRRIAAQPDPRWHGGRTLLIKARKNQTGVAHTSSQHE